MAATVNKDWGVGDIPALSGKLAVVTGATGGLGYETSLGLALAGADVVLVGRNDAKGGDALRRILAVVPGATVRFEKVDLASLASVEAFATRMVAEGRPIDILVNNAAVMANPKRQTTEDGFELQFGTNYLSHFALTGRLLPLILASELRHVVQVSSGAHKMGKRKIDFDDLQNQRSYSPWNAYCQSKLAMLMFSLELDRRSDALGWGLRSNAAHPGYSRTDLVANGPGARSSFGWLHDTIGKLLSQSAAAGALPILYAAAAAEAEGGGYYGPAGFQEMKGPAGTAVIATWAQDEAAAKRLWDVSEVLTGVRWG